MIKSNKGLRVNVGNVFPFSSFNVVNYGTSSCFGYLTVVDELTAVGSHSIIKAENFYGFTRVEFVGDCLC